MNLQNIVKNKYRIVSIKHSGRKGIRGTEVSNPKYDDILGCIGWLDVDDIKQFERYKIDLVDSRTNDWWLVSEVLALTVEKSTGNIELETANSLYELEEIHDE